MKIVAQRVASASVTAGGRLTGRIGKGLCVFIGVAPQDTEQDAKKLADKIANLRIFGGPAPEEDAKMNYSVIDAGGAVLAVSQFTLYADCRKGRRPSFTGAAPPELGNELYGRFVEFLRERGLEVACGEFGAFMKVEIINDGPVTIILDSAHM
jgi:D-tyrosyl-tRNA(Tyr) deacylase